MAITDATAHRAPPGLAAAVVTADGAVELVTSGLADVGTLRPVTAQTTFLWFSMTKIVTATAAMMLADRGMLDLDAPAVQHVPEMRTLRGPAALVTARRLLVAPQRIGTGLASPDECASRCRTTREPSIPSPPAASPPAAPVPPGGQGVLQQPRLPRPR